MFEGQGIGRDVFRVQIQNPLDGGLPGRDCLFRQAVDQVEVEVIEPCLTGRCHGFDDIKEIVGALQHSQLFVVRRLDPKTDAVNAKGMEIEQIGK